MRRYRFYALAFGVGFFGWIESAFAGHPITLSVFDSDESPYQWNDADCDLGKTDLTVKLADGEEGNGSLRFTIRDYAARLKRLPPGARDSLDLEDADSLALSFEDRQGNTWIFKPHHQHGACHLTLEKENSGAIEIAGTCPQLYRLAHHSSFSNGFEIPADEPIVCRPSTADK